MVSGVMVVNGAISVRWVVAVCNLVMGVMGVMGEMGVMGVMGVMGDG
jgi:hypothetical protein